MKFPSWLTTEDEAKRCLKAMRRSLANAHSEIRRGEENAKEALLVINELKARALKEGWDLS